MSTNSVKTNVTFGLQEFLMLLLQSAVIVVTLLLFTRGLATKEDINRLDGRIDSLNAEIRALNQNYIDHLSAHHIVPPKSKP